MNYFIEYYCISHKGNVRSTNQDNYCCLGEYMPFDNNGSNGVITGITRNIDDPIFAVFDGMGGEESGEMAAFIAARKLAEYKFEHDPPKELFGYCKSANDEICEYTEEHSLTSMGTTAAILLFCKNKIFLCNIGDSKIFQFTDDAFRQISYDHISISAFGTKPPLTQNLGIKEDELIISPYTAIGDYHSNDVYLICSDGLTDMISNDEIKNILINTERANVAEALLQKALENGGKDNITILLLFINKEKNTFINRLKRNMRCVNGNK